MQRTLEELFLFVRLKTAHSEPVRMLTFHFLVHLIWVLHGS